MEPATYTPDDVVDVLRKLGVCEGDCIFINAGLRALGRLVVPVASNTLDALFASFMKVIGKNGTLAVPTFNFGFCKGQPFDVQNTAGESMGQFSEYVRRREGSMRSPHPFQSVAAIGRHARQITAVQSRTAFSAGGSFDQLLTLQCKIVFFGTGFVETFVHVAEERGQVGYRFWKSFTADLINHGVRTTRTVDFYARDINLVPEPEIDNDKLGRYFLKNGTMRSEPLGSGYVSLVDANSVVNDLTKQFAADNRFALKTPGPMASQAPFGS
jgi:aminoglycoside 3-N-acetyltransferase